MDGEVILATVTGLVITMLIIAVTIGVYGYRRARKWILCPVCRVDFLKNATPGMYPITRGVCPECKTKFKVRPRRSRGGGHGRD